MYPDTVSVPVVVMSSSPKEIEPEESVIDPEVIVTPFRVAPVVATR